MPDYDAHAVNAPKNAAPQHEPRVPGGKSEELEKSDPPGKPFRTPSKTKTHPAPETGTDGDPLRNDNNTPPQTGNG